MECAAGAIMLCLSREEQDVEGTVQTSLEVAQNNKDEIQSLGTGVSN